MKISESDEEMSITLVLSSLRQHEMELDLATFELELTTARLKNYQT